MTKHIASAFGNKNQWWRYLIVIVVSLLGGQFLGGIPLMIVIGAKMMQDPDIQPNLDNPADLSAYGIENNTGFILMIIPFIASIALLILFFRLLHKKKWTYMVNGTSNLRWPRFFAGVLFWGGLMVMYYGIMLLADPTNFEFQFNPAAFFILMLISVMLLPFQTSYEELLFRGYLAQGIGTWTKSRWLAIIIPSILFAAIHGFNPEIAKYGFWIMMPQYFTIGAIFAIASTLDDGIEIAMGAHTINNVFMSLFISFDASALTTDALIKQKELNPQLELVFIILAGLIFLFALSKRYGWKLSVLNEKVVMAEEEMN